MDNVKGSGIQRVKLPPRIALFQKKYCTTRLLEMLVSLWANGTLGCLSFQIGSENPGLTW